MKKTTVINSDLSRVIAQMGHFDTLAVGDAGMPVPAGTEKIDLAVTKNLPSFIDVLKNILSELQVQRIFLAEEMKTQNPKQLTAVKELLPNVEIQFIPHDQMKADLSKAHAFVRTGEMTPYSNIILESGVTF
ncbi:D-ribose pyranase [Furfurilactobacillus rossiae]|uniref:D-ribose pyranase n=1 Tax=Furfurilactobacillus rossiae DSM 15814 TaxID=1114972 RepID=A0A0R1RBL0_9LACO|nr:D-ribose pyranase [Furfurilactobacillus rossiae]KRL54512.1 D-ribose pyranase [Furfurilactobacillus rossiae DSM 15814]MCF6165792.1 D-ribose pyranase [Furfurilactobacillus rossiae]QFR67372.1 D-ribose pyranase [Furfurilactobacillus rossiae]QLE60312.1 Ribose ABC transport system high affinity permease RbsD [Furfurilactobacillus rossiae]QLE63084.1 Ribose ABC transport system high affinity permease RbsD [Furfurilactobacillus rossiae]